MEVLEVKIKKVDPNAVIPVYAHLGEDAGLDLTATSIEFEDTGDYGFIKYKFGLCIEIPQGYFGMMTPRSSISKTGLILANTPGILDSGFRGEFEARFKYIAGSKRYEVGDKVAQLIILPYPLIKLIEVQELSESKRMGGSYGSTGQ
jgi:dUTP pyrophosphatase